MQRTAEWGEYCMNPIWGFGSSVLTEWYELVWVEKSDSDSSIIKLVQMSPAASHSSLHHELRQLG